MSTPSASPQATSAPGARLIIRVVLATVGALAAGLLAVIWSLLWLLPTGSDSDSSVVPIIGALTVAFVAPVILFVLVSSWPIESPGQRHPALLISSRAMGGLEVAALAIVIVTGPETRPWAWVPISAIAMGVGFTAIALVLGRLLRSEGAGVPTDASGELVLDPWTPPARSRVPIFAVVVAAALVFVCVLALLVFRPWEPHGSRSDVDSYATFGTLFALSIGFIVTSIVVAFRSIPLMSRIQKTMPRDVPTRRRIARAVMRGAVDQLGPVELEISRRYAAELTSALPWSLLQFGLVFTGILCQQIAEVFEPFALFGPWFAIGLGVIYLAALGFMVECIRRARRFVRINGEPTATDVAGPDPDLKPITA